MKFYELNKYFEIAIWACGADGKSDGFALLLTRFKKLYKKMSPKGMFSYLKEALRITVCFLADQPVTMAAKAPYIKRDSHGLPTVLPWSLRKILLDFKSSGLRGDKGVAVCILTLLSVYRIFSNKVRPNLKSILAPFSGTVTSFDVSLLQRALREISVGRLAIGNPKLLLIEKASPNCQKSTWGSSLDAVALMLYPKTWLAYAKYALATPGGWKYLLWSFFIQLCAFPILCVYIVLGIVPNIVIAKLSVVHDQSGKARIVGITNWWIQVILEPLHQGIMNILKRIPMDGTFDQVAPLKLLMSKVAPGQKFYSFDLSSATDRLPVQLQRDILNCLVPNLGTLWMDLLGSLKWRWKSLNKRVPIKEVCYSVGQPMGAYSSWAMLALSHHVIVQIAALNAGKTGFTAYCVLGDDIVIADDTVAAEYLILMRMLGVDINLSKSLQSIHFAEFAKKWLGPNGLNLSPLGPGLILRLIRNRFYLAALLTQMFEIGLIPNLEATLARIQVLPSHLRGQTWNSLWAAFGLNSFVLKGSQDGDHNFLRSLAWCFSLSERTLPSATFLIKSALVQTIIEDRAKAQSNLDQAVAKFLSEFGTTLVSQGWPNRMLEFLLKIFSPGVFAYFYNFIEQQMSLDEALGAVSKDYSMAGLKHTVANTPFNIDVSNIDWKDRTAVKENIERARAICKAFEVQMNDLNFSENGDIY
ncbi:MAG: RNA-dependent RNA polymerase [Neofusicoccum parvum mitovirus 1]|uniref:RNA-dependent RNA polymerase n=1 Tax=Neofusicoccum parvum mitovirus 1 TaxID=2587538 RepID=UPI002481EA77|nr:MAG: RNA-dependent RNA polymerase [Neofusicoccum parvum mitovirus 1]QDB74992.1 MAG: RNA-dependent RNA polymerase [Neofusicoccum parvum mitovirus 1]